MRSISKEANYLSFTMPSSYFLVWCNDLLETTWLRHNKNSKWFKAVGCAWSWCCPFQSFIKKVNYILMKKV